MVQVLEEILLENNRRARNDLERRIRSGTGVREFKGRCGHVPDAPLPGETDDVAARMLRENTKPSALRDMVATIMEQASKIFERVQAKGKTDGMAMDSATEVSVLRDVIKECMIRHILKLVNEDNSGAARSGSHDAGLLATPQGFFGGDLENFGRETIRGLMEDGYAYEDDFLDDNTTRSVMQELEFLEFDGKLVDVQQQKMIGIRSDKIHWLTYEDLDREKQPGLETLMKKMISIPFELNKKCSLYLQASSTFQVACYSKTAYYKRHVDGGYEDTNNGRKITAVFYANDQWSESEGGQLRIYKRKLNPFQLEDLRARGEEVPDQTVNEVAEEIEPLAGRLVLFRSRDVPHEVLPTGRKRFAVSLWLMGPPGPGDMPDGHHAKT
uniref:Fe2OG dioxygenase domain-containing protein n=1 Tax=Zooxanthella nutricula TaxID=1333877 RepID=A0A7S2PP97_9DINO